MFIYKYTGYHVHVLIYAYIWMHMYISDAPKVTNHGLQLITMDCGQLTAGFG